jgi:hypothetical protein
MRKKRTSLLILSLFILFNALNTPSNAESQSAEDMSYQGATLLIASPFTFLLLPIAATSYFISEDKNPPDPDVTSALIPSETIAGALLTPIIAAAGSGEMIAGLGYMPIEAIKKQVELKKSDVQNMPVKPGQPTANLRIRQDGQTKNVQIPLEVKPNLIQLNQKIETIPVDPEHRIPVVMLEPPTQAFKIRL